MKKVKLIEICGDECNECDAGLKYTYTDWDEISDEDYDILMQWVRKKNESYNTDSYHNHLRYTVLTVSDITVPDAIADYITLAKVEEEKRQRKVQEAAKKKKEREKKQKEKDALEKRALFEKLKSQFEPEGKK